MFADKKIDDYLRINNLQRAEPIIIEQWVVEGGSYFENPNNKDSLYIKPILNMVGGVPENLKVIHSLVLDNNVFSDVVDNRRENNNKFLVQLLKSQPLELNPLLAIFEQRQKYAGATKALSLFVEFIKNTLNVNLVEEDIDNFENELALKKDGLISNIENLSGYISAIVFLYHQNISAVEKLVQLSSLVEKANIPYLQLHYYFASLIFLAKEKPDLFDANILKKIQKDMKIENSFERQEKKILNISNDLALPSLSIISSSSFGSNRFVFPYIATRDLLLQVFLSEIKCSYIEKGLDGVENGAWELKDNGLINIHLGEAVKTYMPQRKTTSSPEKRNIRKSNVQPFSHSNIQKLVEFKNA